MWISRIFLKHKKFFKIIFPHKIHILPGIKMAQYSGFWKNIHKSGVINILSDVDKFVKRFFHTKSLFFPPVVDFDAFSFIIKSA